MTIPTRKYVDLTYAMARVPLELKGMFRTFAVELPDISYYRRRPPTEKPEDVACPIIVSGEKYGTVMVNIVREFDCFYIRIKNSHYPINSWGTFGKVFEWWAYAYLPPE